MDRTLPALQEALEDWRDLASDRDAADALLHFEEARERWKRLTGHLDKLRTDPPRFDAVDLEAVLSELGSARQMKRQIIEGNELEVLVPTLRAFLFEEEPSIEEKLAEFPDRIRYAGHTILAELWGWAHLETWPLYTLHAVKGLRALGWDVPRRDYSAFCRAFSDLRGIYEAGERVAPRLPLHLEMDHFLEWAARVLSASRSREGRVSSYAPGAPLPGAPRRTYAIREFGAPYDSAPAPLHAWPDRPLPSPDPEHLERAERRIREQLALPPDVIRRAAAHLLAGRHLILTGVPGTGKSHLATLLASELFGYYPMLVTATAEWSAFDVVGGLVPLAGEEGALRYGVRPGVVYEALRRNWLLAADGTVRRNTDDAPLRVGTTHEGQQWPGVWLIIDELNRADVDKAFGDLFTALESGTLRVPRVGAEAGALIPLPRDFRIIATLNTRDRHFLFTLSDALKRRFAFVEIEPPGDLEEERATVLRRALALLYEQGLVVEEATLARALDVLYPVITLLRAFHPLGTAPLLAVARYVGALQQLGEVAIEDAVEEAIVAEILPQLEGLRDLPLRLLARLFQGEREAALDLLGEALERAYGDTQPLGVLTSLTSLVAPPLVERAAVLRRQSSASDPGTISDALALLGELREHAAHLPAPRMPRVARQMENWLAERG